MGEPVLQLRGVSKGFPRRAADRHRGDEIVAVEGFSLTVEPGETVGLVGESGAGKSTVGRIILGLDRPDGGHVLFDGVDIAGLRGRARRKARHRMHLILQDPYESLHPGLRVRDLVGEPLAILGVGRTERRNRVHQALEEVALTPASRYMARFPHELSGGQRQRIAMARAFVGRPRLIVADEPTSMLDASARAGILELILATQERLGTAFLFITHDLAVARYVSRRIAVMRDGRLVESAQAERLIASPREEYTRSLLAASQGKL